MSAFDELRKIHVKDRQPIEWTILIVSDGMIEGTSELDLAEKAAAELAALRKRLEEAEEIITMAAHMVSRDEKEAVSSLALEYVREYEVEA